MAALFFTACQPESNVTGERVKSEDGSYEYLWLVDVPGDTLSIGDYVEYHAYVRNGDELVLSTRDRGEPVRQELNQQLANEPVVRVMLKMSPGDSVAIFTPIPPGRPVPQGFEGATEIRYDVQLEKELDKAEYEAIVAEATAKQQALMEAAKAQEADVKNQTTTLLDEYKAGTLDDRVQTTESGLKYVLLEEGEGSVPDVGDPVSVHYYGMLMSDGTPFDNSYGRGSPIDFPLGQGAVIKGWDEGIGLLKPGAKAIFFIPADLAYGASGRPGIPADSDLAFYVNLL